jgi:uncharacterized protein
MKGMINYCTFLFVVLPLVSIAQNTTGQGEVFAINDYRHTGKQTIIVKWFAQKVYYTEGFNVYRKAEDETTWSKINAQPIRVKPAPPGLNTRDQESAALLDVVHKTPYNEFQKGLPKVFVVIKAILSAEFAELLGIVYYDEAVSAGKHYQYEVRGILNREEEVINTSKPVIAGAPSQENAPQSITVERKAHGVEINWLPEELRYYGVNVYRRPAGSSTWTKINEQPRNIYKSENQHGEETYPDVFYLDVDIKADESYEYHLTVVDYFGREGIQSAVFSTPVVDFIPPPPPLNLQTSINVMELTLSWDIQLSEDLEGFKVYRSAHADSMMRVVHAGKLPKVQNKYTDVLLKTGGYYYAVAAVDHSGNEASTGKIFIEVRDVIPPAPPKNVRVSTDTGKVVLNWNANTEPDLRGYYVYRSLHDGDHSDNEYVVMNTSPITSTTYTEILPKNVRNKFVYAVVAEDQSYNRSKRSDAAVVQLPDVTPPARPLVKTITVQDNTLVVEWLPNIEADLAGYDIYRSADSVTFKKLNVNAYPRNAYRYTDRQIETNQRYYYYIQAIDSAGNRSLASNIFTAINRTTSTSNSAPYDVRAEYVKNKKEVKMTWKLPDQKMISGSVLFKSSDNENFRPVTGLSRETTFTDKEIKKGATYYYQVRSYTTTGSVNPSETVKATIQD